MWIVDYGQFFTHTLEEINFQFYLYFKPVFDHLFKKKKQF